MSKLPNGSKEMTLPPPQVRKYQKWAHGDSECALCKGAGRVRRPGFNQDGTRRKRDHWETCQCVGHGNRGGGNHTQALTIYPTRLSGPVDYPEDMQRPKWRHECANVPRPCPFISCRFNTYLEVVDHGHAIRLNHGNVDPLDRPAADSCSLDVAEESTKPGCNRLQNYGVKLERVGEVLGLTRERIRQVEVETYTKLLKRFPEGHPIRELFEARMETLAHYQNTGHDWDEK